MPLRPSVVVTCYNFRPYIAETLRSLADQTHRDVEVVVVDNNSTDGSVEILERFVAGDDRFTLVGEVRQGIHHALNAGIARATGDLVLFLDGDDVCRPDRVAATLRHVEATGADLVACNGQRMTGAGQLEELFEPYFHSAECLPAVACQYNPIWTVSFLALTRGALEALGPLPEHCSRILDWHLLLSAFEANLRVVFLDAPLVLKRYHGQNLAFDLEATERQAIPRLDQFLRGQPAVREVYGPEARSRLLTVRYVRAVEQMRRAGRWAALPDYLADCVGPDRIRDEVQRFVAAVAWYHVDRRRFTEHARSSTSDHPLWLFVRGLAALEGGDAPLAARCFERAYVTPMRRFLEALNSWAVAVSRFDLPRAISLLEHLVRRSPDYRDAQLNLMHLRHGQADHCRHTVCLRPETLHWLGHWPG